MTRLKKGIDKQAIFDESEKLLENVGIDRFSLRELSRRLGIKPASLYNHIRGIEEIYKYLSKRASDGMKNTLLEAMKDKPADEAFVAGAFAYRRFAEQNHELYLVLIRARSSKDEETIKLGFESFAPIRELIKSYGIPKEKFLHFIRSFRAFLHGFVEITHNGFMQKGSAPKDETFLTAVNVFLKILKEESNGAEV